MRTISASTSRTLAVLTATLGLLAGCATTGIEHRQAPLVLAGQYVVPEGWAARAERVANPVLPVQDFAPGSRFSLEIAAQGTELRCHYVDRQGLARELRSPIGAQEEAWHGDGNRLEFLAPSPAKRSLQLTGYSEHNWGLRLQQGARGELRLERYKSEQGAKLFFIPFTEESTTKAEFERVADAR